jgi:hypothetical protein
MVLFLFLYPKKRIAKNVPKGIDNISGDIAAMPVIPKYFFAFIKNRFVRVILFFFLLGKNFFMIYSESKINSSDKKTETDEPKRPAVTPIKSILKNEK